MGYEWIYPPLIKHVLLENQPFMGDFRSQTPPFVGDFHCHA